MRTGLFAILAFLFLAPAGEAAWKAQRVTVLEGFETPESVVVDQDSGMVYVSNVDTRAGGPWAEDAQGFISRLKPEGEMDDLRWVTSTPEMPIHGPKGMCIHDRTLYVADIDRVLRISLRNRGDVSRIRFIRARRLNDMATDGDNVYVSDTGAGLIYRVEPRGYGHKRIEAPPYVNGITFHEKRLFAVSWALHEVYDLSRPEGEQRLNVSRALRNPDGIEILGDRSVLVSDHTGGTVVVIPPSGGSVYSLLEGLETPADIGVDRERNLLYVPLFGAGRVAVYRLISE